MDPVVKLFPNHADKDAEMNFFSYFQPKGTVSFEHPKHMFKSMGTIIIAI